MPTPETLERFIARVEQNVYDEAMQENQSPARCGRDALIANERKVLTLARSVVSKCVRPTFVNGDYVVIRWIFEFVWLDGSATRMEELAYQRWEGERVAEEQFFYDPAQLTPEKSET